MSRTGDGHGGTGGPAAGTVAARCLLVLVTLLCAIGLCSPATAAGHPAAGQPPARTEIQPPAALDAPADSCHGAPGAAVSPVLPLPVALHVPPQDPPPPALRPVADACVHGPVHDATPAVDLHRLQVHRT